MKKNKITCREYYTFAKPTRKWQTRKHKPRKNVLAKFWLPKCFSRRFFEKKKALESRRGHALSSQTFNLLTIWNMFILEIYTLFVSLQCVMLSVVQNIQGAAMKPVTTLACNVRYIMYQCIKMYQKSIIDRLSITISHSEPIAKWLWNLTLTREG